MVEPSGRELAKTLEREHLPALDGLRAVAVMVVMCSHSTIGYIPGDLGVSAFFVLSGFLITWLLLREQAATGHVALSRFYARRTLRIFPAYYAFLLFSLSADSVLGTPWSLGLTAAAFFYGMNYYNAFLDHPGTSLAHCWSLAVEEQFYLLWPWIFRFMAPRGRRALALTLTGLACGVLMWRSWLFLGLEVGTAYVYNAFDTRFDNLAVGCLLALAMTSPRSRGIATQLARSQLLPVATLALIWFSRTAGPAWHYGPGFSVDALLLAVLVIQLIQLARTPLWRWLDHPVVRYVGRISYPMYLWHAWGFSAARQLDTVPASGRLAIGIALTTGVASLSYLLVEKPFLRIKHRYSSVVTRR